MAIKNSTRFAVLFLILAASGGFAQTRYVALSQVEDPPYGIVAQLWNASTTPVYLEFMEATGAPSVAFDGMIAFGFGLSNLEEQQCQPVAAYVFGGSTAVIAPNDGLRITQQPCTPNGQKYGIPIAGLPPCAFGTNYTCTNFAPIKRCWLWSCSLDLTAAPLVIQPGTGITVYTQRYKDPYFFSWSGYASVNFRWHR